MKKREKPSTRDWDNERLYPQKEKSWKQIYRYIIVLNNNDGFKSRYIIYKYCADNML